MTTGLQELKSPSIFIQGGAFGTRWNGENDEALRRWKGSRRARSPGHRLLSATALQCCGELT